MSKPPIYQSTINFRRTPEEKVDQILSWKRSDKAFFAAGACHILAFKFLELYPDLNFKIIHLKPKLGFSGNHVYVSNGTWAFDFGGWNLESELLEITQKEYSKEFPGWEYERLEINQNIEDFCNQNNHRLPENFAFLPWERANKYIQNFKLIL